MNRKLIMPKQTSKKEAFYASLALLYDSHQNGEEWYSNEDFKREIQVLLPELTRGAKDGPYLVKQSELVRYFGLAEYDYESWPGRSRITKSGIEFYEDYLRGDLKAQQEILMNAILNNSFGRNNSASESSDSDIDPPKLFIKALYDLGELTNKDFAYLLYLTHDLNIFYDDAISELEKDDVSDREIPAQQSNKYNDVKFIAFLASMGIVVREGSIYRLSAFIKDNYRDKIEHLSIYNRAPEFALSLKEDDSAEDQSENPALDDVDQARVIVSRAYDVDGEKFKLQNRRVPEKIRISENRYRYKTNPRIAKTALEIAEYQCVLDNSHETFPSKLGTQFMEAHHLVPISAQKDFSMNLDCIENIVSICPNCHSAIHFGDAETRRNALRNLYDLKIEGLNSAGIDISFEELFEKYYQ